MGLGAEQGGQVQVTGNLGFKGSYASCILSSTGSMVWFTSPSTITTTGLTVTTGFLDARDDSTISLRYMPTTTANFTGKKFHVFRGGKIIGQSVTELNTIKGSEAGFIGNNDLVITTTQ